jgi:hypothetical protein
MLVPSSTSITTSQERTLGRYHTTFNKENSQNSQDKSRDNANPDLGSIKRKQANARMPYFDIGNRRNIIRPSIIDETIIPTINGAMS